MHVDLLRAGGYTIEQVAGRRHRFPGDVRIRAASYRSRRRRAHVHALRGDGGVRGCTRLAVGRCSSLAVVAVPDTPDFEPVSRMGPACACCGVLAGAAGAAAVGVHNADCSPLPWPAPARAMDDAQRHTRRRHTALAVHALPCSPVFLSPAL